MPRVLICAAQVPFARGGAEMLVDSLAAALGERGVEAEVVRIPFSLTSRTQLLKSALAWRLVDFQTVDRAPVDRVICTRFPSYLVRHPVKVVWLIHQLRQVYDLRGTEFSDFGEGPRDRRAIEMVRAMDRRTLSEARRLFTISGNVARRLEEHVGLAAEPLYPPPPRIDLLAPGPEPDGEPPYVVSAGRLDRLKRFDLLVRAVAESRGGLRAVVAGDGPERGELERLAGELGVADRVGFPGFVADEEMARLYRGCRAVWYAPFDEDYGYVTVEAMRCAKPVVTCADAGGVLEFVRDGETGFVCPPGSPRAAAAALDRLLADPDLARRLGDRGRAAVEEIGWDRVVDRLME